MDKAQYEGVVEELVESSDEISESDSVLALSFGSSSFEEEVEDLTVRPYQYEPSISSHSEEGSFNIGDNTLDGDENRIIDNSWYVNHYKKNLVVYSYYH